MRDDLVGDQILVRRRFGRAGYNQRRPRLVDQDRVNLVDNGEMVLTLHHVLDPELEVVAKIVETEFVVRAVGDITAIGRPAFVVSHIAGDAANGHAKAFIDAPHPGGIARRQIIIHRDDMDALAGERVQKHGQCRDKGFALAGFHFGNLSLVERDTAHQLDIVMALPKGALGRFAHTGEGFGKQIVETAAGLEPFAKGCYRAAEVIVADRGKLIFKLVDRGNLRGEFLGRTIGPRPEEVFRQ